MTKHLRAGMMLTVLLGGSFALGSDALSADRFGRHFRAPHFVPNSQRFWDNSKNWTTNYGPAYRDTLEALHNLVPCTGDYALCFHSGPEPMPCEIDRSGRFADCTCTVERGLNFVVISAILNYRVYLETIEVCGVDGSACADIPDKAPVCEAIRRGKLIPPARRISTYDPESASTLAMMLADEPDAHSDDAEALADAAPEPPVTMCPKGPYAACMTAPCRRGRAGAAVCSCPVFYGTFQLYGEDAQCDLGDGLVNSASYLVPQNPP